MLVIKEGISFFALPLQEFEEGLVEIPYIFDEIDDNGKEWVVVQWQKDIHKNLEQSEVAGHIVYAGCEKDELTCDSKNIYKVYHPKNEWDNFHMVNLDN